jgi:hypothetical protein
MKSFNEVEKGNVIKSGEVIMKKNIIEKITEMRKKNDDLYNVLNEALSNNHYEYYQEEYGGDFIAGGYDGDSISHMLDILTEQNYMLDKISDMIINEN